MSESDDSASASESGGAVEKATVAAAMRIDVSERNRIGEAEKGSDDEVSADARLWRP